MARNAKIRMAVLVALAAFVGCACNSQPGSPGANPPSAKVASAEGNNSSAGLVLEGAGASFPYPVYAQWAHRYQKETGVKLNYQSIGSGGGIAQIKARTVHFGASDAPLDKAELEEAGVIQFPMVMGGVVPVANVPGVEAGALSLSRSLLADIYLGKVTRWNDPSIASLNPQLTLPELDITVVHRADGSGTTWIFTDFLSKVSPEWKDKAGTGKSVEWPTGVGGKGNEGVAANVQRVKGAIGYVEFAYALQNQLAHLQLDNPAGKFVQPTIETFQAAAANADWKSAPGFYMVLTNQPGDTSWPITGASFILVHKQQEDAVRAEAMLAFFQWCYEQGKEQATELHYVPMPDSVVELVKEQWKNDVAF